MAFSLPEDGKVMKTRFSAPEAGKVKKSGFFPPGKIPGFSPPREIRISPPGDPRVPGRIPVSGTVFRMRKKTRDLLILTCSSLYEKCYTLFCSLYEKCAACANFRIFPFSPACTKSAPNYIFIKVPPAVFPRRDGFLAFSHPPPRGEGKCCIFTDFANFS